MRFLTLVVLFAALALCATAGSITNMPWNLTVPPLADFLNRTPSSFNTSSLGNGSYNYSTDGSSSTPGHDTYTASGGYGNYNYSNAAGYTIDLSYFSLYAGTYDWNQWGYWNNQTDTYYGDGWASSFGSYSNESHIRENANNLNVFSWDLQTFFLNQFLMNNGSDWQTNGFCSSYYNPWGSGGGCSSSNWDSNWTWQDNPIFTLNRGEFLKSFYNYTEPSPSGVPEPSTYAMMGAGLVALAYARRPWRTRTGLTSRSGKRTGRR